MSRLELLTESVAFILCVILSVMVLVCMGAAAVVVGVLLAVGYALLGG